MCTFTRPICSTCHNTVGIGSTNACGLMPEGMAVWFCPEMIWKTEEVVKSCHNCPREIETGKEMSTSLKSIGDALRVWSKKKGIESSRSSVRTKVEEEEFKSSNSSVNTKVEVDNFEEERHWSRNIDEAELDAEKDKKEAVLESRRSTQKTKVKSKSSWSSEDTKVEDEEEVDIVDIGGGSLRSNDETTDQLDKKKDKKVAEALTGVGRDGTVMINGYLVDEKWEKKRQEMIADEKRKWSKPRSRIGCCIVQ